MPAANPRFSKTVFALAAMAAIVAQPGCRSLPLIPGQWLTVPGSTAGPPEDFSRKITSHLFENGMMIGVGNDERFLYVFFTPDIRQTRRIPGRARLLLWLDREGGRAKTLGLEHVRPPRLRENRESGDRSGAGGATRPAERPGFPAADAGGGLLRIIDRSGGREILIAADGSQGPAVRLASDWGDFAYQLRIPFQGTGDWPELDLRPGQVVGIGVQWRMEPHSPPGKDRQDLRSGRPGRGGSGGGRMGPPAGMEDGPPGMPNAKPAAKRKAWLRIRLAQKGGHAPEIPPQASES
ncbi:MAG: hypothetical protein JXO51_01125 [Candidatus Aminicenantes bacterium]|nr:hypothetical protein [Candidatus Aminicenantes bacterium]